MAIEDIRYEDLFLHPHCARCRQPMTARAHSYFTDEVICMECGRREADVIDRLQAAGADPRELEHCGYVPAA